MGKTYYRHGTVLNGDYAGKSVYIFTDAGICILSNDENGKIIVKSLFPTRFSVLCTISNDTVLKHEIVSQGKNTYDIAIYFKDGKKSLIRLFSSMAYQELCRTLFIL